MRDESPQRSSPAAERPGRPHVAWLRSAWLPVALLVPVALLNYLDRQMLATMKSSMVADVAGLQTDAQWGFVLACFRSGPRTTG